MRNAFVPCDVHLFSTMACTNPFTENRVSPVHQFHSKQVLGQCQNNQADLQTTLDFNRVSIGVSPSVCNDSSYECVCTRSHGNSSLGEILIDRRDPRLNRRDA